jgi:hypothetical protein
MSSTLSLGTLGMMDTNTVKDIEPIEGPGTEILNSDTDVNSNVVRIWKGKGREGSVDPDGLGEEHEWRRMQLEMIECTVPLRIWPGNTAFRPNEIFFRL